MARPLRIERAGGWYHVTARGNERRAIFRDNRDRQHFCELLAEFVERFRTQLHAYVLMENHYHLLLELTESNLSQAAQWLNVSYSVWFNRRHDRCGHLFQGRFKSVVVDPGQWGLELSRYVHLNPVRVRSLGLGKADRQRMHVGAVALPDPYVVRERIARLRRYMWSSFRAYAGLAEKPKWLECEKILELGGAKKTDRHRIYRDYVETAVREGLAQSPWEHLQEQIVLGGAEFLEGLREFAKGDPREQHGVRQFAVKRPKLQEIIANAERLQGRSWNEIRDRHGDPGRDLVLFAGRHFCGLTLRELAEAAGMKEYGAASTAIRRFERELGQSKEIQGQLQRLCEMSNVQM